MNLAAGVVLTGVFAAASPGIAALYHRPRLTDITLVLSADFLVGAIGIVQLALLQRQMRFRRLAVIQNVAAALGGTLAIVAAALGAGVWSLVIEALAATTVQSVLALYAGVGLAWGRFDRGAARELWQLSGGQAGYQAINYWSRNADNLIAGRFVGAYGLGIYDRAYQVMLLPVSQVGLVVSYVLFPALARMQDDVERLRKAYLRSIAATALLAMPIAVALFAIAPDFVLAVFGDRWIGMTPILRLLCIAAVPQSIGSTVAVIYQARGRTDWLMRWGVASGVVTIAAFGVGVIWGVKGIAAAYAVRTVVLHYFNFAIPGRLIGVRYRDFARVTVGALAISLVAGAAMWGVGEAVREIDVALARLGCEVVTGVIVYAVGVRLAKLAAYRDLVSLVRSR
jgi:PST family polysaccharide transporter